MNLNNIFRTFIAISLIVINCFSSLAFAESVEQFLTRQTNIRVIMSGGPNFGDQANTFNVMSHLRELGFTGQFEIVYDNKDHKMKVKMATLFDLPDNFPDFYEDKKQNMTFLEKKTYLDRLKQGQIALDDIAFSVGSGPNPLYGPTAENAKADLIFSSYFNPQGGAHDKTHIELLRDANYADHQQNSGKKFFVFPISTYQDARNYLFNTPKGQNILVKKPGLISFLAGLDTEKFNVINVYGRTLRFKADADDYEGLYGSKSPSNILQVIAGVRYAQLHGGAQFDKPVIIAMFYDYQELSKQLIQLLNQDNWGDFEQSGADIARQALHELNLPAVLSIADLNDPKSIDQINNLQAGQILLLSIGSLPKIVFDGIYNHTAKNVWPQVYEGAGTFSALNFTGRPRFECADTPLLNNIGSKTTSWTLGFNQIKDAQLKQRMKSFYTIADGFCGSVHVNDDDNFMTPWKVKRYESFGQFIIEATDERSAFSEYFTDVKKYVFNPESDRIRFALEEVIPQL